MFLVLNIQQTKIFVNYTFYLYNRTPYAAKTTIAHNSTIKLTCVNSLFYYFCLPSRKISQWEQS